MLRDNKQFNESIKSNSAFLDELRQKMPEFFTASKYDEEGNLVESSAFDNEKFQQALKEHNIDELSSGYRLDFIGKNYAKKQAGERPTTVIVPDYDHNQKEENKNSKNLFFTGDNLEVLRHLQQNYANSVDFIYIDPPYNTGSDGFVYPDKFEYTDEQLKNIFALNDDELKRLKSIQGKATHSAWLTFMYPRLYLAKKVLKETGVIFVSIDDNEQANLKLLMDEVFGEEGFVEHIIWKGKGGGQDSSFFVPVYESILVYSKNINNFELGTELVEEDTSSFTFFDKKTGLKYKRQLARKWGSNSRREDRPNLYFGVTAPDGSVVYPKLPDGSDGNWRHSKRRLQKEIEDGDFEFVKDEKTGNWILYQKLFASPNGKKEKKFTNLIDDIAAGTGTKHVQKLFGGLKVFDYPKPVSLIKRFLRMLDNKNALVLDFFAGSSTTAEAVMQQNIDDNGYRQFIMCTLPEPTFTVNSDGKEVPTKGGETAYKAGYKSIDEISRERIIRAANKIKEENPLLTESQDFGFKHYRVVPPTQETLEKIDYDDQLQLDLFDDMIDAFSSEKLGVAGNADGFDTILHTYLAKDNYQFDVPLQMKNFAGIQLPYVNNQRIYLIANNWQAENTRALVNAIGKNELVVQTIVVYGYTLEMESLRELEIALNQLENKVNLQVRY